MRGRLVIEEQIGDFFKRRVIGEVFDRIAEIREANP
jgi:hypothetical protein